MGQQSFPEALAVRLAGAQHHMGHDAGQAVTGFLPGHGAFGHGRMPAQHALHLQRGDP